MPNDMEFANRTAATLLQSLAQQVETEVVPQNDQERFQAMMGPIVVMLASIFEDTIRQSPTPRQTAQTLMSFYGRWVCTLCEIPEDSD